MEIRKNAQNRLNRLARTDRNRPGFAAAAIDQTKSRRQSATRDLTDATTLTSNRITPTIRLCQDATVTRPVRFRFSEPQIAE